MNSSLQRTVIVVVVVVVVVMVNPPSPFMDSSVLLVVVVVDPPFIIPLCWAEAAAKSSQSEVVDKNFMVGKLLAMNQYLIGSITG